MPRPYERYRKQLLASSPWCANCSYEPARDSELHYHHPVAQSLGGDHASGILLCKVCHDSESARQRSAHKQVGADGYRINDVNPFRPRKRYKNREPIREDHWC